LPNWAGWQKPLKFFFFCLFFSPPQAGPGAANQGDFCLGKDRENSGETGGGNWVFNNFFFWPNKKGRPPKGFFLRERGKNRFFFHFARVGPPKKKRKNQIWGFFLNFPGGGIIFISWVILGPFRLLGPGGGGKEKRGPPKGDNRGTGGLFPPPGGGGLKFFFFLPGEGPPGGGGAYSLLIGQKKPPETKLFFFFWAGKPFFSRGKTPICFFFFWPRGFFFLPFGFFFYKGLWKKKTFWKSKILFFFHGFLGGRGGRSFYFYSGPGGFLGEPGPPKPPGGGETPGGRPQRGGLRGPWGHFNLKIGGGGAKPTPFGWGGKKRGGGAPRGAWGGNPQKNLFLGGGPPEGGAPFLGTGQGAGAWRGGQGPKGHFKPFF